MGTTMSEHNQGDNTGAADVDDTGASTVEYHTHDTRNPNALAADATNTGGNVGNESANFGGGLGGPEVSNLVSGTEDTDFGAGDRDH